MDAAGLKEGVKDPPWAVNHKILSDMFPKRHKRLPEELLEEYFC